MILFDLDNTLTESRCNVDVEMVKLFEMLLAKNKVAIISGVSIAQLQKQFLKHLTNNAKLENLSLFPEIGTSFYTYKEDWALVHKITIPVKQKQKIISTLLNICSKYIPDKIYGELIDDRGGQVALAFLGLDAPLELKKKFDADYSKRLEISEILKKELPNYEIIVGGTTTISVVPKGINKAYCIPVIKKYLGYDRNDLVYVGDALFVGGDDYSMKEAGVKCVPVKNISDTKVFIRQLLGKVKVVAIAMYADPIHEGHLSHMEAARKLGDKLIVFAGTEEQCQKKHGIAFHTWDGKVKLLKKLGADEVFPSILDENGTCSPALLKYRPDIFAKGEGEVIPQKEIDTCNVIGCEVRYGIGKRLNNSSRYFRK